MAGFQGIKDIVDRAYIAGRFSYASFRKVPALASTLGVWCDLSMAPGNPKPNYYATAEKIATVLDGNYGLFHFGNGRTTTDGFKFLHKLLIFGASASYAPAKFMLCDYLLYYPLIDMDDPNPQEFTNSVLLPRYADGMGVKAMVIATNPFVGGGLFQITYTNERGETGRKSQWMTSCSTTNIGTVINSGIGATLQGPFINLQNGDLGIRSVQFIEFSIANGGLATVLLVKPLATICTREITAASEIDFVYEIPSLPKIYDGAYLNFLCMPNGSVAAAPFQGEITTIWRN